MKTTSPILGAHMSIAGGYHKALESAGALAMGTCQIFTKNNNQWRAKPISDEEADRFKAALKTHAIAHPLSHDSYLINLAAPDPELWKRSIDAFIVELQRAEQLAIPYVVAHPGAYTTTSEAAGLKRIALALDEVHAQTPRLAAQCLLELTAGQGSNLGWRFEHMATILDLVNDPDRLGLCFDTCHVFAAGYPLALKKDYQRTMKELDQVVGLSRIKAFHLNDSKKELGSRVDRHEHIGQGKLGLEAFRNLLNDRRFKKTPMYLETPKGPHTDETTGIEEDWDATNLRVLRNLVGRAKTD
ncbi:MAG TPA: deoxyribonuclease IV [Pirellulales bacterium]|jgi:deoxyribonuclease-4|nr:deoxyribonuclease IV [Pirellulales bacterium]